VRQAEAPMAKKKAAPDDQRRLGSNAVTEV